MAEYLRAKVALSAANFAIDKPYDYLVPPELAERIAPGMRVLVPFGRGNKAVDGVALALEKSQSDRRGLKGVLTLLDDQPVLSERDLKLCLWMSRRYFCTVYQCAKAMLPTGLWFSIQDVCRLGEGVDRERAMEAAGRSKRGQHLVELLAAHPEGMELKDIRLAFGAADPMPTLRKLAGEGIVTITASARREVGDKTEQVATLAISGEDALAQAALRRKSAPLQYSVVELLCAVGQGGTKEICYLTGATPATLRALERKGIVTLTRREVLRELPMPQGGKAKPFTLTQAQQTAYERLEALSRREKPGVALLYGVTGSGKTQVYIKLIDAVLARGKTALVLVPEIALTPQLLRIFTGYFGDRIAVLHSSMSEGQRYDQWKRARSGKAGVVIGARSAVFAPLENLGLVVLDEEHEGSYKSENVPRYHAREVAQYRCAAQGALLVLGSATPAVESMYLAKTGRYHMETLPGRYNQQALPRVIISDMKKELRRGNDSDVGQELAAELADNIARGEQSILFLNRRGARQRVVCGECGEAPTCPRCSVYLTYHSANHRLMCHHCGHSQPLPEACPVCGGELTFVGSGTQRLQATLEEMFPGREILRMDADAVSPSHTHQSILDRFARGKAPILLGTQMVAKGLDFENVTLVGVIAADSGLYLPDFRAAERTFSLITQVVGRAGRGSKAGRAVIQTYTPDNDVIAFAAKQDYDSFYEQEIGLRQGAGMPPFREVFVLTASGQKEESVLRACQRLRWGLEGALREEKYRACRTVLLGPAPASIYKLNDRYRYQLTLSCEAGTGGAVRGLAAHFLRCAMADRENRGVSLFGDSNPMD